MSFAFDQVPDLAVLIMDADLVVEVARGGLLPVAVRGGVLEGRSLDEVARDVERPNLLRVARAALGGHWSEYEVRRGGGTEHYAVRCTPIDDPPDGPGGVVITVADITASRALERELRAGNEELLAQRRFQDEMTATTQAYYQLSRGASPNTVKAHIISSFGYQVLQWHPPAGTPMYNLAK